MRRMTCKDVLLLNFGGPETTDDVEIFLRNLFSDTFGIRFGTPAFFQRFLAKKISRRRAPSVAEKNTMRSVEVAHLFLLQKLS